MSAREYMLYAAVIFGWSTSWYPLSLQVGVVAPEVSLVWRFTAAGALMFLIALVARTRLVYGLRDHLQFMALGATLFSCNFVMFYYASIHAASGLLAVIFSLASLENVLLAALLAHVRPPKLQVLAACMGLCGLALIFYPELRGTGTAYIAIGYGVFGTMMFCTGNMISAATQRRGIPIFASTSWGMVYGAIIMTVVALVRGHEFIIDPTPSYVFSLAWLVVTASVLAFICYLKLVGSIGPGRAGYVTVVFPIVALMVSARFEAYEWSLFGIAGLALVIGGNVIMVRTRS